MCLDNTVLNTPVGARSKACKATALRCSVIVMNYLFLKLFLAKPYFAKIFCRKAASLAQKPVEKMLRSYIIVSYSFGL